MTGSRFVNGYRIGIAGLDNEPRATLQPPVVVDDAFGGVNGTSETPLKPLRAGCYLPDSLSIFATFLSSSLCSGLKCNVAIQSATNNAHRCTYAVHLSLFQDLCPLPSFLSAFFYLSLSLAVILASTSPFSPRISLSIITSDPIRTLGSTTFSGRNVPPLVFFENDDERESREKLLGNVTKWIYSVLVWCISKILRKNQHI